MGWGVTGMIGPACSPALPPSRACAATPGWKGHGSQPRTSQQIVKELHTLLRKAGMAGPYVLVGHSFGGLNVRLYADHYPDAVVGMVLVDAAHEDQWERLLAVLPPAAPGEAAVLKRLRTDLEHLDPN